MGQIISPHIFCRVFWCCLGRVVMDENTFYSWGQISKPLLTWPIPMNWPWPIHNQYMVIYYMQIFDLLFTRALSHWTIFFSAKSGHFYTWFGYMHFMYFMSLKIMFITTSYVADYKCMPISNRLIECGK